MIVIRQPSTVEEYREGINLLSGIFQRRFQTFPRELPSQFFLAFDGSQNDKVVGTINLHFGGNSHGPLEVEKYFDIRIADYYSGSKAEVAEIGRLTSTEEMVFPYMLCAITLFARDRGIEFFFSFNKRAISRIVRASYMFPFAETVVTLKKENIPPDYFPYFMDERNPVVLLHQPVADLLPRVSELIEAQSGDINIILPDDLTKIEDVRRGYLATI